MVKVSTSELAELVKDLRAQVAHLTARLETLESPHTVAHEAAAPQPAAPVAPPKPEITEQELLAISAALAAYLGVRPHIRSIRLISSGRWAQEGRVSIQASHRLHS